MFNNTHDGCDTVSNIFCPYLRDLPRKFWGIYYKCSNSVNFCIVRHQTMTKTPTRWSVTSTSSVGCWGVLLTVTIKLLDIPTPYYTPRLLSVILDIPPNLWYTKVDINTTWYPSYLIIHQTWYQWYLISHYNYF